MFDRQRWMLQVDVLAVQMLAEPLEARSYGHSLTAIGARGGHSERVAVLKPVTLNLLHEVRARMLVDDEVHTSLRAPRASGTWR